jgi:hypothetical protein
MFLSSCCLDFRSRRLASVCRSPRHPRAEYCHRLDVQLQSRGLCPTVVDKRKREMSFYIRYLRTTNHGYGMLSSTYHVPFTLVHSTILPLALANAVIFSSLIPEFCVTCENRKLRKPCSPTHPLVPFHLPSIRQYIPIHH